ncbi:hypothetical protein JTE90_026146 [Oedothorax gibbosus]|uniref:Uncharacterized protein n=1 Tax=Oedothorax gibbosus TaxID=931172 RepID=A0AAV6V225_9ARAC|nr:hypothetical protein JTE90_026146 [Oedothorax gibbosus]
MPTRNMPGFSIVCVDNGTDGVILLSITYAVMTSRGQIVIGARSGVEKCVDRGATKVACDHNSDESHACLHHKTKNVRVSNIKININKLGTYADQRSNTLAGKLTLGQVTRRLNTWSSDSPTLHLVTFHEQTLFKCRWRRALNRRDCMGLVKNVE